MKLLFLFCFLCSYPITAQYQSNLEIRGVQEWEQFIEITSINHPSSFFKEKRLDTKNTFVQYYKIKTVKKTVPFSPNTRSKEYLLHYDTLGNLTQADYSLYSTFYYYENNGQLDSTRDSSHTNLVFLPDALIQEAEIRAIKEEKIWKEIIYNKIYYFRLGYHKLYVEIYNAKTNKLIDNCKGNRIEFSYTKNGLLTDRKVYAGDQLKQHYKFTYTFH